MNAALGDVKAELAEYGATLNDENVIVRNGRETGVTVLLHKARLKFTGRDTLASYALSEARKGTRDFVTKFWFWEKVK